MRIVSLLPAATEIVCALGARAALVGISHECDYPADVAGLPVLTRAHGVATGSAAIHEEIVTALARSLSPYALDAEALRALAPDVVVTQDLCHVCAVSAAEVHEALAAWVGHPVQVISLRPTHLRDIPADIRRIAAVLGREAEAEALLAELRERMGVVTCWTEHLYCQPRVVSIEWLDPVMLGGLWMPELILRAGGLPLGPQPGEPALTLDAAALRALAPEVVVIKPCGFPLACTLAELPLVRTVLPWDEWPAVAAGQVYLADGNAYFNRPGPRIVDSLEILAGCVHPTVFPEYRAAYQGAVVQVDADLKLRP